MKHYGDICKLKGEELPEVDIITGGSPCQDLSIAGKRAGLDGERSGLFMEQIRVIKEMRAEYARKHGIQADDVRRIKPRFMVWENVPGAFSSNNGEDFRAVLEETARIVDPDASIPGLEDGESWRNSGFILGDEWAVAWRVHDAQFWGVPQRRRRISLVADFGGQTAPEILFERESVPGDIKQGGETGQGIAADLAGGNSIALPFWEFLAGRMVEQLKADGVESPTMASLFDGIGGFPLVFSRCGCSPIWASEIEEFPIAVTKIRFPEVGDNDENI